MQSACLPSSQRTLSNVTSESQTSALLSSSLVPYLAWNHFRSFALNCVCSAQNLDLKGFEHSSSNYCSERMKTADFGYSNLVVSCPKSLVKSTQYYLEEQLGMQNLSCCFGLIVFFIDHLISKTFRTFC